MLDFLKKHKMKFVSGFAITAVLILAFFAGGKLNNSDLNNASIKSATSDIAASAELSDETVAEIINDNPDASSEETKDKSKNSQEDNKKDNFKEITADKQNLPENSDEQSNNVSQSSYIQQSYSDSQSVSKAQSSSNTKSDIHTSNNKDKYLTDPTPKDKPKPVEPQEQEIKDESLYCTFSISCSAIFDNMAKFVPAKTDLVPKDGWILKPTKVKFNEGESVYDVLKRVCQEKSIHMESSWTPIYNSAYIEGINNIYEFDCGSKSGWEYSVNDWFPNYGCSRSQLKNGDIVEWKYTCNLGKNIGSGNSVGGR